MRKLKEILPTHQPSDSVWDNIAQELSPLRQGEAHIPPESVWASIESQLSPPKPLWQKWRAMSWYAAASLLLPLLGVIWFWTGHNPKEAITYSEEKAKIYLAPATDDLDQQYARIQALCLEQIAACETSDFKNLKRELDDLTTASQQLKAAMGSYNTDASLEQQLSAIERERGKLLRRLEQKI